jgi:trimethylamine monooxygenase
LLIFILLRLWSNGPKELVEYVNYTFDDHFGRPTPSYQPRSVVYDYLIGRAKRNDIRKYIRFHTAVRHVDNQGQIFKVTVEDLITNVIEDLIFDYVVVAPGRYSTPNMPQFDGIKQFPGRVLHAKSFRDASEFADQHVLIIGSSYSAEDITLQLYKFGARTITISYRTRPLGYKWPDKKIKEVPLLMHIENRIAYFQDGTKSDNEIDSIIFCTGYQHHYPFMAEHLHLNCPTKVFSPPNLYKGIIWSKQPNLAYLGMQSLVFQFTMYDVQVSFVRDVILDNITNGVTRNLKVW